MSLSHSKPNLLKDYNEMGIAAFRDRFLLMDAVTKLSNHGINQPTLMVSIYSAFQNIYGWKPSDFFVEYLITLKQQTFPFEPPKTLFNISRCYLAILSSVIIRDNTEY